MFSLLAGFLKWLFSKEEIQILILGLDHAGNLKILLIFKGKTTLLEQMKRFFQKVNGIPLDKIPPTVSTLCMKLVIFQVGLNLGKMDIDNYRVVFWDLGGQARLRSIWANYYSEAHGLIFVIDSTDKDRFIEARKTLKLLLKRGELTDVPVLICLNKQDIPNSTKVEEINQILGLNNLDYLPQKKLEPFSNNSNSDRIIDNFNTMNNITIDDNLTDENTFKSCTKTVKIVGISAVKMTGVETGINWLLQNSAEFKAAKQALYSP